MGFLSGKKILITGIASKLSIAYGIAKSMKRAGAELALTYQNSRLRRRVELIAKDLDSNILVECDVSNDSSIIALFENLLKIWNSFDGFVHSIAFAPREELKGDYINVVTKQGFQTSHEISSYSFLSMAKRCRKKLNKGSCLLTISYLGSQRAIPNYNVMGPAKASLEANVRYMANSLGPEGIRVNCISPGPIKTLAASGIRDFRNMMSFFKNTSPLKRLITLEEIGNTAAFLCSNLASGISGEIIHVDGGFNITAMNDHHLEEKF